mmetsp:Transcript_48884/g.137915  ORF Transcript_48884/g.137915 Transcript_48884/m.137915 type:complete len:399 (+) Transcript_48884:9828-11024(+)
MRVQVVIALIVEADAMQPPIKVESTHATRYAERTRAYAAVDGSPSLCKFGGDLRPRLAEPNREYGALWKLARVLVLPRVDLRDVRWHVFFEGRALPACEPPARDDDGIRLDEGTVGSLNNPRSVPPFSYLCCATAEPDGDVLFLLKPLNVLNNLVAGHEATRIRANRSARKVREVAQRIFSHQPKTVPTMRPPGRADLRGLFENDVRYFLLPQVVAGAQPRLRCTNHHRDGLLDLKRGKEVFPTARGALHLREVVMVVFGQDHVAPPLYWRDQILVVAAIVHAEHLLVAAELFVHIVVVWVRLDTSHHSLVLEFEDCVEVDLQVDHRVNILIESMEVGVAATHSPALEQQDIDFSLDLPRDCGMAVVLRLDEERNRHVGLVVRLHEGADHAGGVGLIR